MRKSLPRGRRCRHTGAVHRHQAVRARRRLQRVRRVSVRQVRSASDVGRPPQIRTARSECFVQQRQYAAAFVDARRAVDVCPDDRLLRERLGQVEYNLPR